MPFSLLHVRLAVHHFLPALLLLVLLHLRLFPATPSPAPRSLHHRINQLLQRAATTTNSHEAEEALRHALQLAPAHPVIMYNLGTLLLDSAHFKEATELLERSVLARPQHAPSAANLGVALEGSGRAREARYQYEQALRLNPTDERTGHNIGRLVAAQTASANKDHRKRAAMYLESVSGAGGDSSSFSSGGSEASNALSLAVRQSATAIATTATATRNQALWFQLGLLHDSNNDTTAAVDAYRNAALAAVQQEAASSRVTSTLTNAATASPLITAALATASSVTTSSDIHVASSVAASAAVPIATLMNLGVALQRQGARGNAQEAAHNFALVLHRVPLDEMAFSNLILVLDRFSWKVAAAELQSHLVSTGLAGRQRQPSQSSLPSSCQATANGEALSDESEKAAERTVAIFQRSTARHKANHRATLEVDDDEHIPASHRRMQILSATALRYHCCKLREVEKRLTKHLTKARGARLIESVQLSIELSLTLLRRYIETPNAPTSPPNSGDHLARVKALLDTHFGSNNDGLVMGEMSKDRKSEETILSGLFGAAHILRRNPLVYNALRKAIAARTTHPSRPSDNTESSTITAPPSLHLRQMFDEYSAVFDDHVLRGLQYEAPRRLREAVAPLLRHLPACTENNGDCRGKLLVLDLGVGTGLAGSMFRSVAKRLVGVDMSAGMVAQARAGSQFDRLYVMDIGAFLSKRGARGGDNDDDGDEVPLWDVVISSDVLCYFGELDGMFKRIQSVLSPAGGILAFTIEVLAPSAPAPAPAQIHVHAAATAARGRRKENQGQGGGAGGGSVEGRSDRAAVGFDFDEETKRYRHSPSYVRLALTNAGMTVVAMDVKVLRTEGTLPVWGIVVVAQRRVLGAYGRGNE